MFSATLTASVLLLHGFVFDAANGLASPRSKAASCKNIPGDASWPAHHTWDALNATLAGSLIFTVPAGHVCHDPAFSAAECQSLMETWPVQSFMATQSGDIMSTWFQNNSCVPWTSRESPCELGNYASYIINVRGVSDVVAGLRFAQANNIRLVIKNSGHDFYGKSTGKGALSLWTHNLKTMQVVSDYDSSYYQGPAIKLGAGVSGGEAAQFASQHNYRIVTGSCPTVGLVGGYTQGGGHSLLSGRYGFSADNVLEWEVVLASGEHVVATPTSDYRDLYWALGGGGGGTYGVVISMTVRVFPEGQTAMGSLILNATAAGSVDKYWRAVGTFLTETEVLVNDHGIVSEAIISSDALLPAIMAPGLGKDELMGLLQPLISALAKDGIPAESLDLEVTESSTYYDLYLPLVKLRVPSAGYDPVIGGRLVTRSNLEANSSAIVAAIEAATGAGDFTGFAVAFNAKGRGRLARPVGSNSVQPALLDTFITLILTGNWAAGQPWSDAEKLQEKLVNEIMPALEAVTPGSGVYKNEGNWAQPDFEEAFYGSTYRQLRSVKAKYDPNSIFYGLTAVGSEDWTSDAQGRLCRA